jgi:hypothetical protein
MAYVACGSCGNGLVDPRLAARHLLPTSPATPEGAGDAGGHAPGGTRKSRRPADDKGAALAEY